MEENFKYKTKSIPIPIKKYDKDFDTELGKEKKQEILTLFTNSNNLHSEEELQNIEYNLHQACKAGDVELVKNLLSETIENDSKFTFKINKTNQTASLFKVKNYVKHLIIPRTFTYESTEYLITSISCINNGDIKTLQFAEDSAVQTIYGHLFPYSNQIDEMYFPASLRELKEGCFDGLEQLTKIVIPPSNTNFVFKEDKYLLGKSDNSKDEYDVLLFASRSIEEITIPSNIKIIGSHAFGYCDRPKKIEVSCFQIVILKSLSTDYLFSRHLFSDYLFSECYS
ncbi:hypothetical protein M9Y10_043058 [Tritrichomonas musculus]|uniref:Uncharacterized protein n=1 Tax=Tritrichomonas musculus TaxID=1915356 RepID=A0ABR2JZT4_9EUKA